jgi:amino acid permease
VKTRVAQVITIVLFALVMGVFWGTWFSLSRTMSQLSPETFLAVGHEMIQNLGTPMAILLPFALLSALITLVLARQEGHAAAFRWVAAGFCSWSRPW